MFHHHHNNQEMYGPGEFKTHMSLMHLRHIQLTSDNLPPYTLEAAMSMLDPHFDLQRAGETVASVHGHLVGSKVDINVGNATYSMHHTHMFTHTYSIGHPRLGELKWKHSHLPATSATLTDADDRKWGYVHSGLLGQKLEVYEPCDLALLDLIVASGMIVRIRMMNEQMDKMNRMNQQ